MKILDEGTLDKALTVPEEHLDPPPPPCKTIYGVIGYEYFKQSYINFPKEFCNKMQNRLQCFSFYSC